MPAPNTISVEKLSRLVGTPKCPVLIDVRTEEDFAFLPHLIPSAVCRAPLDVAEWASAQRGRSAVAVCQHGLKLSQGTAAWLRHEGVSAEALEGGIAAWQQVGSPMVPDATLARRDQQGRTVWLTRAGRRSTASPVPG